MCTDFEERRKKAQELLEKYPYDDCGTGVTEEGFFQNKSGDYPDWYLGFCHKQCYSLVILEKGSRYEDDAPVYKCSTCGYGYLLPFAPDEHTCTHGDWDDDE